jgi:hypothetical protein
MRVKLFGITTELERILFIIAFLIVLAVIGILIWKLIHPFVAVVISVLISYLYYLRDFIRGGRLFSSKRSKDKTNKQIEK